MVVVVAFFILVVVVVVKCDNYSVKEIIQGNIKCTYIIRILHVVGSQTFFFFCLL